MELTISDLKPFLPGLEAALGERGGLGSDDQRAGDGLRRTRRADGGRRRAGVDHRSRRAGGRPDRAPLSKDPNTEPIIDARLADGSRVAICGPPWSPTAGIAIRRFGGRAFTVDELTASGSRPGAVVDEAATVLGREPNLLISGGTGSGKTTLLNALVSLLPADSRIISIEDTLEARLRRAQLPAVRGAGGSTTAA